MKRYLVFTYDQYYPAGPENDFKDAFETLAEAETYVKVLKGNGKRRDFMEIWELDVDTLAFTQVV